ncbi:hypothetical protein WG66_010976 [Moniliophthora roreri]|nr:hypothetical protein WG66_010976 [Moniliophthora roreri]
MISDAFRGSPPKFLMLSGDALESFFLTTIPPTLHPTPYLPTTTSIIERTRKGGWDKKGLNISGRLVSTTSTSRYPITSCHGEHQHDYIEFRLRFRQVSSIHTGESWAEGVGEARAEGIGADRVI